MLYYFEDETLGHLNKFPYGDIKALVEMFRDILNEKVKLKTIEEGLVEEMLFGNKYKLAVFRKIACSLISENWEILKHLFWKKIDANPNLLSSRTYKKSIYELLNKNQNHLEKKEIECLNQNIEINSCGEYGNKQRHYWYSALRENVEFKEKYEKLSLLLNLTSEEYERVDILMGLKSPLSVDEILIKNNGEIISFIKTFVSGDGFHKPSTDGLMDVLRQASKKDPYKFRFKIT